MTLKAQAGIRNLLPRNPFARGVSVLVGGTAGAQLLLLLASPLLTRLYTPDDFGLLAVYASILAIIGVVGSLRYELAIPLPKDDQEAVNLLVLCLVLLIIASLLTAVLVFLLGKQIASLLGVPELADYFWLLPVGVLICGTYQVFSYWGIRKRQFRAISTTKLKQALATLLIQLLASKLGAGALLFGQVAGQGVGATTLFLPLIMKNEFRKTDWTGICYGLSRYKRFPLFTTWAGLLNTGGTQLPPVLITAFFGATSTGLYALAHRALSIPIALIGDALQGVFFSDSAEAHRNNKLGQKVEKLLDVLVQVALPPAIILVIVAPDLFANFFGEKWREAGVMARYLIPWLVMQFCVGPLTLVNAVTENQKLGLYMQMQLFAVRITTIVFGSFYGDILKTIFFFSLGSVISYFAFLWSILFISGLSIMVFFKAIARGAFFGGIIALPTVLYHYYFDGIIALVGLSAATLLLVGARYHAYVRRGI